MPKPLAFVVNIPIKLELGKNDKPDIAATIANMKAIIQAYTQVSPHPPFSIVFGVNTNTTYDKALRTFMKSAKTKAFLETQTPGVNACAITSITWTGKKFPYGTVRNELMHSEQTQNLIQKYQEHHFQPYVAIGDADTGKRTAIVDNVEKHMFQAIADRLTVPLNEPIDIQHIDPQDFSDEYCEIIKNYTGINKQQLQIMTAEAVSDALYHAIGFPKAVPLYDLIDSNSYIHIRPYLIGGGYRPSEAVTSLAEKTTSLQDDMNLRTTLANQINPLGPYFPEPNLFIDGSISQQVSFSSGGAEFSQLRTQVSRLIEQHLLDDPTKTKVDNEQYARAKLFNNTHPERAQLITSLFDLAIETDTDRLFKKAIKTDKKTNIVTPDYTPSKISQHHRDTNQAKSVFLQNRYNPANGGGIYTSICDFIQKHHQQPNLLVEFAHELMNRLRGQNNKTPNQNIKKLVTELIEAAKKIAEGNNITAPEFTDPTHLALNIWYTAFYQKLTSKEIHSFQQTANAFFTGTRNTDTTQNNFSIPITTHQANYIPGLESTLKFGLLKEIENELMNRFYGNSNQTKNNAIQILVDTLIVFAQKNITPFYKSNPVLLAVHTWQYQLRPKLESLETNSWQQTIDDFFKDQPNLANADSSTKMNRLLGVKPNATHKHNGDIDIEEEIELQPNKKRKAEHDNTESQDKEADVSIEEQQAYTQRRMKINKQMKEKSELEVPQSDITASFKPQ